LAASSAVVFSRYSGFSPGMRSVCDWGGEKKMKESLANRKAQILMATATVLGVLGFAGLAGAVPYDPTSGLTTFATGFGSQLGPIVLAVAGAVVGIVILFWGVKFVFGLVHARART
jgi:hypothetical protein